MPCRVQWDHFPATSFFSVCLMFPTVWDEYDCIVFKCHRSPTLPCFTVWMKSKMGCFRLDGKGLYPQSGLQNSLFKDILPWKFFPAPGMLKKLHFSTCVNLIGSVFITSLHYSLIYPCLQFFKETCAWLWLLCRQVNYNFWWIVLFLRIKYWLMFFFPKP